MGCAGLREKVSWTGRRARVIERGWTIVIRQSEYSSPINSFDFELENKTKQKKSHFLLLSV